MVLPLWALLGLSAHNCPLLYIDWSTTLSRPAMKRDRRFGIGRWPAQTSLDVQGCVMMVGKPTEDLVALEDFTIPLVNDLPPLPWEEGASKPAQPILANRLWTLMNRAACNVIPPLSAKADSALIDELGALSTAARHWRVGSAKLDQRLWTRSGPYWRGEIAMRLAAGPPDAAQGFLLLLAKSANARALLSGHGAPLAVRNGIAGSLQSEGPHLALIACVSEPTGEAFALTGFTQPVLSARCFMPINSNFERDVLHLLLELQVALDAHGIDCAITRPFDEAGRTFTQILQVDFGFEGHERHRLTVELRDKPHAVTSADPGAFFLSPAQLDNGMFIDWLEEQSRSRMQAR